MSEQTEEPTARRIDKAREDGDSGVSAYASQALAFLVAVTLVPATVAAVAAHGRRMLRGAFERVAAGTSDARLDAGAFAGDLLALVLPLLFAVGVTAAITSSLQAGGGLSTKKLAPDLSRLDPFAGFGRLLSLDRVFSVGRALVASSFVAWLTWRSIRDAAPDLAHTTGRLDAALLVAAGLSLTVAKGAAAVGILVAALDVLVTRRSWLKRLRMSKDDVKREHKESEGDPEVKAARERARHEVMTSVVVAKVKEASVVVVNPTHLACALRYDEDAGDGAPVVVASGRGDLAARIVEAAHAYGVPVVRDVPLARALIELEVDEAIPEALYEAVAEILRAAWEEE